MTMTPQQALSSMGLSAFRGRQEEIVQAILSGRDAMVLMATAGGKSLCYTVPALCLPGYAVVVSPLIALMDDQKAGMEGRGVRAAVFRGGQSTEERRDVLARAARGEINVILMPPELLTAPSVGNMLAESPPSFVAFDEAHCISTWGQDFRPDYSEVGAALDDIGAAAGQRIQRVALTATASARTVEDIISLSHMVSPCVITSPLVRNNLAIFVNHAASQDVIDAAMLQDISYFGKASGIVYCRTRKECERTGAMLQAAGVSCAVHHSGMAVRARQDAAQGFMKGVVPVMVATIGFGMGIDKADVRYVLHNGISPTPEAWYQEIGRGGRDGNPAAAITYTLPLATVPIRAASDRRQDGWGAALDYSAVLFGGGCRMQAVMSCFGEESAPCGRCDNCLGLNAEKTPAIFDSEVLSSVKALPGKSPGQYLRQIMGASPDNERKIDFQTSIDALFCSGLIDYDIIQRESGPPVPRLVMTAEGLTCRSPAVETPVLMRDFSPATSLEAVCASILKRSYYDGRSFSRRHAQTICVERPGIEDIRRMDGVNLPDHLIRSLAPHDRSQRPTRVRDRMMTRLRM